MQLSAIIAISQQQLLQCVFLHRSQPADIILCSYIIEINDVRVGVVFHILILMTVTSIFPLNLYFCHLSVLFSTPTTCLKRLLRCCRNGVTENIKHPPTPCDRPARTIDPICASVGGDVGGRPPPLSPSPGQSPPLLTPARGRTAAPRPMDKQSTSGQSPAGRRNSVLRHTNSQYSLMFSRFGTRYLPRP